MIKTIYWHGGRPGIRRGGVLLPPSITKVPSLSEYGAAGVHRRDRVYVTIRREVALMYAAGVRNGVLYQCVPIGDIDPDPDCLDPGLSWQCSMARVLRVINPREAEIELVREALLSTWIG